MQIRQATLTDVEAVAALAQALWPHHTLAEMREDMAGEIASQSAAILLAEADGEAIGFAQCSLRHDYVEGTRERPVGYLEGIYILPAHRRQGVAGALVDAGMQWARSRGCREMASDCLLDNAQSIAFHLGAGFAEANRLVCFVKEIAP